MKLIAIEIGTAYMPDLYDDENDSDASLSKYIQAVYDAVKEYYPNYNVTVEPVEEENTIEIDGGRYEDGSEVDHGILASDIKSIIESVYHNPELWIVRK